MFRCPMILWFSDQRPGPEPIHPFQRGSAGDVEKSQNCTGIRSSTQHIRWLSPYLIVEPHSNRSKLSSGGMLNNFSNLGQFPIQPSADGGPL